MGIEVRQVPSGGRVQPKAVVGRTLPNDLISKTIKVFNEYETIPLHLFTALYAITHNDEILDAAALGFDNGLVGFFEQTQRIKIERDPERGYLCRLIKEPRQHLNKSESVEKNEDEENDSSHLLRANAHQVLIKRNDWMFDVDDQYLWSTRAASILLKTNPDKITIAKSPLEMALERNFSRLSSEIRKINDCMARFPYGIGLSEIYTHIDIDKRLFNVNSIDYLVDQYPELFYVVESKIDGIEKRVFDGRTRTDPNISSQKTIFNKKDAGYLKFILGTIVNCVYQKTLILLKTAGAPGMKLSCWHQSMIETWPDIDPRMEKKTMEISPLTIMLYWRSFGMIKLESPKDCKNDLRIKLPIEKINFEKLCKELFNKMKTVTREKNEERWRRIVAYDDVPRNSNGVEIGFCRPSSSGASRRT